MDRDGSQVVNWQIDISW